MQSNAPASDAKGALHGLPRARPGLPPL